MKIADALQNVQLLGVDSAAFIYYVERDPAYSARMQEVFRYLSIGSIQVSTATLTLTEVLNKPIQSNDMQVIGRFQNLLLKTKGVSSIPLSAEIAEQAAALRAVYSLRTPDAVQIATALSNQCDAFLTNDRGLKRVKEIQILYLDDLIL